MGRSELLGLSKECFELFLAHVLQGLARRSLALELGLVGLEEVLNLADLAGQMRVPRALACEACDAGHRLLEVQGSNLVLGEVHVGLATGELLGLGLFDLVILGQDGVVLGLELGTLGFVLFNPEGLAGQALVRGNPLELSVKVGAGRVAGIELLGRGLGSRHDSTCPFCFRSESNLSDTFVSHSLTIIIIRPEAV